MKKLLLIFCFALALVSCKKDKQVVTKITAKTIAIDSLIAPKNDITAIISPYKDKMIKEINTVLSYTPTDLVRTDGALESTLGNLLADLSYNRANPLFFEKTGKNIDFALFNYGGIRAGISKGNITNKNAFELMPFENSYVVAELTGEKIQELINYLITQQKAHPLSKQIRLTVTKNGYLFLINNKTFDNTKSYYVLTTDYLQSGGDGMDFFKNPKSLTILDYKMRHAIIDEFKSKKIIESKLDKRFTSYKNE